MTREDAIQELAARIANVSVPHPIKVAIDGIDAAGKTTLADSLARFMRDAGFEVIRASIDGFHRPRSERLARGALSPVGYYEDSFDYVKLLELLLLPLSHAGACRFRTRAFDHLANTAVSPCSETCSRQAVLLFDGVFLFRPEIERHWDYRIFVDTSFEVALQRAVLRDAPLMGGRTATEQRYLQRYHPGQAIYLDRVGPKSLAQIIVHNDRPNEPSFTIPERPESESG